MIQFDDFLIRELTISDLESYYEMVESNRTRLNDFFTGTTSRTKTLVETKVFFNEMTKKRQNKEYLPYLIQNQNNQDLVGFIDLKNIEWSIPKAEIGCYTDLNYAGKGIMKTAIRLFTHFAFEQFHFKKIFLRTHHSNHAALSIVQSCGFQQEGNLRKEYKTTSGEIVDLLYFGKLREEA